MNFIFSVLMILTLTKIGTAEAIELMSYKDTNTGITVVSEEQLNKVWDSNQPACLKDGSTLCGVNKAYRAKRLKYRDCSTSSKTRRKHKARGYEVTVFKLAELPEALIKKISCE